MRALRDDLPVPQVLFGTAVAGVVFGVAVLLARSALQVTAPAWLIIAVPTAIALLAQLVRLSLADLPPAPHETGTGLSTERVYFSELRRLERRLETAARDGESYHRNVRPELVQLTLGRLRWRHGVNPKRNPLQSREILGESLWQLVTGQAEGTVPMTRLQLEKIVSQIEAI